MRKAKRGAHANAEKIKVTADIAKKVPQVQPQCSPKAANARAAQAKLEARQETISRMAEARSMIRNFQQLCTRSDRFLGGPERCAVGLQGQLREVQGVGKLLYRGTLTKLADASEDEIKLTS